MANFIVFQVVILIVVICFDGSQPKKLDVKSEKEATGQSKHIGSLSHSHHSHSHQPCSNGPYIVDALERTDIDMFGEGIGRNAEHMIRTFLFASAFNLSYIYNPEWFVSLHRTKYEWMFDYEYESIKNHCTLKNLEHSKENTIKIVEISSLTCLPINQCEFMNDTHMILSEENCRICEHNEISGSFCAMNMEGTAITAVKIHKLLKEHSGLVVNQIIRALHDCQISGTCRHTVLRFHHRRISTKFQLKCLSNTRFSFYESFWAKRRADLEHKKSTTKVPIVPRYSPPSDCLIIAYLYRAGDRPSYIHFNKPVIESVAVIRSLFSHPSSVLFQYNQSHCYHVNFFSECPYEKRDGFRLFCSADEAADVFGSVIKSFPSNILTTRLNHSQHLEDLDMIANSDILITSYSSFHLLCMSIAKPSSLVIPPTPAGKVLRFLSPLVVAQRDEDRWNALVNSEGLDATVAIRQISRELCYRHKRLPEVLNRCRNYHL